MPRYDLYRSVHKFIRRELFQFGEKLGKTDFRNKEAVIATKESFDGLAFDLTMHAQKEEKWFTPLFKSKGSVVSQHNEKEHSDQPAELKSLQDLFTAAIETADTETRIVQGNHIRSSYDIFLAHNLQHFYEEENVLMPELWSLYSDAELRHVTIESYKALPPFVLLDSANFFPVLDYIEKHTYLEDLKAACPPETFREIWSRALASGECFTTDEASTFATEFGL